MSVQASIMEGSRLAAGVQTQTGWGRILQSFADWCQPRPGWRVIDVGCGPGLLPAIFAQSGCQAVGIDLEFANFAPPRLHPALAQADGLRLPFPDHTFHLATASNLLFLLPDPLAALREMARITRGDGQIAMINPSENMSLTAATALADQHSLSGVARHSLITYAARAEANQRWSEAETKALFSAAGLALSETALRMGFGLVRFARGTIFSE